MQELPAEYVPELYRQTAFLSAVLGGFSIAFLGTLLTLTLERKVINWTIWILAFAATSLIVATFASIGVLLDIVRLGITSFDFATWPADTLRTKAIADSCMIFGMYALVIAVGFSGSIRDKQTGIVTALLSLIGLALLTIAF